MPTAVGQIDPGDAALARFKQPQPPAVLPGRVRHRQFPQQDFVVVYSHEDAARPFVLAPAAGGVSLAQRRHILGPAIHHGQTVQVAAIFGCEFRYEMGSPAGVETVVGVEGAKRAEFGVDEPQIIPPPRHLVDVDIAGDVDLAGDVAGVVLALWLQLGSHNGHVSVIPDGVLSPHRQARPVHGDAHRLLQGAKVGVDRAAIVAHEDDFARLVGADDQGDAEMVEDSGQVGGVDRTEGIGSRH